MRKKTWVLMTALALVLATAAPALAQTTKLRQIGRYTLIRARGKVPTPEVMKTCVERYAKDIQTGFELAGAGDLYQPFIDQMAAANFKDTTLAVGDTVQWMLFRSQGKVKVARNVEWAGKQPLEVYQFQVRSGDSIYDFVMPKPCGNVALRSVTKVVPEAVCSIVVSPDRVNVGDPVTIDMSGSKNASGMTVEVVNAQGAVVTKQTLTPSNPRTQVKLETPGEYTFRGGAVNEENKPSANPCVAKTYVNFGPVCKLWTSCMPCEDYVGRPITFDLSGSTDPDGQIVKGTFELTDAAGQVVDTHTVSAKPFLWEKVINKAGTYTITATVTDNNGATSPASDACKLTFEVTQKRLFWLIEAGPLWAKGTYTMFGFLRGGIFYWLSPNHVSFILSAGGAVPFKGDPWRFFFLANALVNLHAGPVFVGGGLGYETSDHVGRKAGLDWVGNVGVDVFNRYTSAGAVFFELRGPIGGSNRKFNDYHKLALGFRLLF